MKIGVTFCHSGNKYSELENKQIKEVERLAQDRLEVFEGIYIVDMGFFKKVIIPLDDIELRVKAFDLYKNTIPIKYHPCYEELFINEVSYDDIKNIRYMITLSILDTPSEEECECSSKIDFSNIYRNCPVCKRKILQSGNIKNISYSIMKKYKGGLEFPNNDIFCLKPFMLECNKYKLTGIEFDLFKRDIFYRPIFKMQIPRHNWKTVPYSCESCHLLSTDRIYDLFNTKEEFLYDIQAFRWFHSKGFIISQRAFDLIYPIKNEMLSWIIPIIPNYKYDFPLQKS